MRKIVTYRFPKNGASVCVSYREVKTKRAAQDSLWLEWRTDEKENERQRIYLLSCSHRGYLASLHRYFYCHAAHVVLLCRNAARGRTRHNHQDNKSHQSSDVSRRITPYV